MMEEYDHIVVGLGGIGSAAAYWLARRGARVLGIEQFELGHDRGASQDHSRIIRLSQHSAEYTRFVQQAYAAWADLENDSGETLIHITGGLDISPGMEGLATHAKTMTECGIPFESLDAAELRARWPQFRFANDVRALYQPDAGFVAAARANAAHQRMAREHGATLLERRAVASVRSVDGEVEVVVEGIAYRAGSAVLTVDAWINVLLAPLGHSLPLVVTQEQVVYYAARDPSSFEVGRLPVWIWWAEPSFYGVPTFGEAGPKAGQDIGGPEVTPVTRTFTADAAALARLEAFLRAHVPDAVGPVLRVKTCLYALPPDRGFVLDTIPGHPNIVMALGAAHGYKFVPAFGQVLADLCIDRRTTTDISLFRFDRPTLKMENPTRDYRI